MNYSKNLTVLREYILVALTLFNLTNQNLAFYKTWNLWYKYVELAYRYVDTGMPNLYLKKKTDLNLSNSLKQK